MIDIINRYNKCLICDSELVIKHYDGHSLSGNFYKRGGEYVLHYKNKSKDHNVIFDSNLNITENDGKRTNFHLIKHCDNCDDPSLMQPPYFTVNLLKSCTMFYHIYLNPRRNEPIMLLEELFRFYKDTSSYGWHAKFNAKNQIWNTTIMFVDRSKTIDSIFQKTSESESAKKFESVNDIVERIDLLHTFS